MRANVVAIHGIGDLVGGIHYTVPNNPFLAGKGMGDIVRPARFTVPNNPFTGLSGCGSCGPDCGCGPCQAHYHGGGMGQVDLSLTGSGIITSIEGAFNQTGWPELPNWVFYAAGVILIFTLMEPKYSVQRRHR